MVVVVVGEETKIISEITGGRTTRDDGGPTEKKTGHEIPASCLYAQIVRPNNNNIMAIFGDDRSRLFAVVEGTLVRERTNGGNASGLINMFRRGGTPSTQPPNGLGKRERDRGWMAVSL